MATINPFALVQKQLTQAISAAQQAAKSAAQNLGQFAPDIIRLVEWLGAELVGVVVYARGRQH